MSPRTVWAILRKTYLTSGVVRKLISSCSSSICFLDCGPCPALGCPLSFRYALLAPLQGICFSPSPLVDISSLTCSRCIALIHSGALDRRKTFCGCMRSVFVRHSAQTAYIDIFPIVFSRGFGQHPVVRFLFDQCNGTLGRSTPSWCHKEAFFSHRRVRRNIYNYDRGTLSSDPITGLWLMFICCMKLLIPWLMLVCFRLP